MPYPLDEHYSPRRYVRLFPKMSASVKRVSTLPAELPEKPAQRLALLAVGATINNGESEK